MKAHKLTILIIASVVITLGLSISLQSLLAAWISPKETAPDGNISAPLNTSSAFQQKDGGIILNHTGAAASSGLLVENGNVGIGTLAPGYRLDVVGEIRAQNAWLRTTGTTGWYNETYGGGWYMFDSNWIRAFNNKNVWVDNVLGSNAGLTIGYSGALPPSNGAIIGGNVGIGTTNPGQKLEVNGKIKITDGNQAAGKVLTSDANGVGTWQASGGKARKYYASFSGCGSNRELFGVRTDEDEEDTHLSINGGNERSEVKLYFCMELLPEDLYKGYHTEAQCTAAGGTVSGDYCIFPSYCASGWTYVANWSTTYPHVCKGEAAVNPTGGMCPPADCTTGSHGWSNTPLETRDYGDAFYNGETSSCDIINKTCWANFAQTLCY
ncbi:MAG: shufflon system plasmid conjugative transfer pilus tip adhesin PilV [Patescibacteria group bacterium]|jgi:hypothetical protein